MKIKPFGEELKARLLEEFSYDPETGIITKRKTGKAVGAKRNGYLYIRIRGEKIFSHRVAYYLGTGKEPSEVIDHINGDRADNRLNNLRDVRHSFNSANRTKPSKRNKLGFLGVMEAEGRYKAQIQVKGKKIHLGRFDTPKEAHERYMQERKNRGLV